MFYANLREFLLLLTDFCSRDSEKNKKISSGAVLGSFVVVSGDFQQIFGINGRLMF